MVQDNEKIEPLSYEENRQPRRSRFGILAIASLVLALLSFPVGVGTTVALETNKIVSHRFSEWAGFMIFDAGEGLACGVGMISWIVLQRKKGRRTGLL